MTGTSDTGAVLHGCRVGENAMIGMNAVIMDNAVIGESTIVAAMAFVKAGAVIPPRSLVAGIPGKVKRELSDEEIGWKREGTRTYQALALRSQRSLRAVEPLERPEADRPCLSVETFEPLLDARRKFGD